MNSSTIKLFTQVHLLRQVGRPLLTELFGLFTHLLPSKYFLPNPRPDNEAYFDCLAEVDGIASVQTCLTPVRDGMRIARQIGRRSLSGTGSLGGKRSIGA